MPQPTAMVRALLLVVALVALLTSVSPSASSAETTKDPRLDSHLARLVPAWAGATPATLPQDIASLRDAGLIRFDPAGRVVVFVYPSESIGDAAGVVTAAGGEVERVPPGSGPIQAALPVARLADVAHDAAVRYIGLPAYPALNAGSRITEGDSLLNVDTLRAAYHVNGAGVRVGVISDGIAGFQKSQQSADLPAEIDYQTCNVTPDVDPTSPLAGGEGTAMLEIVHDLAPGADLWFGNFGLGSSDHGTVLDFMAAVDCLAAHVDVIVDDVSWFGTGPYDGTSPVSLNTSDQLNDPSNPVRLYTTSVGNWAQHHYHEPYEPCAGGDDQTFQATAGTVDAHGTGALCYNPITVGPFSIALLSLQWNDPFGASCNDYDLLLKDHNTGEVLASSTNAQTCTQDPVEEVAWTNSTVGTVTVDVVVQNPGGLAAPRDFDIFTTATDLGYLTPAGSVPNQGDAGGGVLSVGAIGAFDQGLDGVEPWSSNGPTADGRTKPDLTAVDCVEVTGNSFFSPFCGTSAAAPHIAGIAALLLQCDSSLRPGAGDPSGSRAKLSDALLQTAQDRGDPGPDNVFGAGLVDPMAAAAVLCPTGGLLGDVDCSTAVNAVDALFILRHVTHLTPEPGCLNLGDVDCNLVVDSIDALDVLRFAAGLPVTQPPGCREIGTPPATTGARTVLN